MSSQMVDGLAPFLPLIGGIGAFAFFGLVLRYGRWRPWPSRMIMERTRGWSRRTWKDGHDALLKSILLAMIAYSLFALLYAGRG